MSLGHNLPSFGQFSSGNASVALPQLRPLATRVEGNTSIIPLVPSHALFSGQTSLSERQFRLLDPNETVPARTADDIVATKALETLMAQHPAVLTTLIKECHIELHEGKNGNQAEIVIGDRELFEGRIRNLAMSEAEKSDATTNTDRIATLIKEQFYEQIWPKLYFQQELQTLEKGQAQLKADIIRIPVTSAGQRQQFEAMINANETFLKTIKSMEAQLVAPTLKQVWDVQQLTQHTAALHQSILQSETDTPPDRQGAKVELEAAKTDFQQMLDEIKAAQAKPETWLGKLYDAGEQLLKKIIPKIGTWQQIAAEWFSEGHFSVSDQDSVDFAFTDKYGSHISALHARINTLELDINTLNLGADDPLLKDFTNFKNTIEKAYRLITFRVDYFDQVEVADNSLEKVGEQTLSLAEGKWDFSPNAYLGAVQNIQEFQLIADKHKTDADPKTSQEIERKCTYQTELLTQRIGDLMEELTPEMQAEQVEIAAQTKKLLEKKLPVDAKTFFMRIQMLHEGYYTLRKLYENTQNFIDALTLLSQDPSLPSITLNQVHHDLSAFNALAAEIEATQESLFSGLDKYRKQLALQPEFQAHLQAKFSNLPSDKIDATRALLSIAMIADSSRSPSLQILAQQATDRLAKLDETIPDTTLLQSMRDNRKAITFSRQRRQWQHRHFTTSDAPSEKYQQFFRFFFFYLQVGTPLVQKFTTPIGKPDYRYYLSKMAEASKETKVVPTNQSYDYYLEKAHQASGADPDFIDNYDLFLRGQVKFTYAPQNDSTEPVQGLLTGGSTSLSDIHQAAEAYLPQGVSNWLQSFLGLNPSDQQQWNRTAWENWVHSNVYPQVQDNFFEGITDYYEGLDPASYQETADDNSNFGHACYNMYMGVKSSSQASYKQAREEAQKFPQFQSFFKEYESYLKAHATDIATPQTTQQSDNALKESALQSHATPLFLSSAPDVVPMFTEPPPMTSQAARANQLFLVTWGKNIASFINSIITTDSEESFEIETKVDNEPSVSPSANKIDSPRDQAKEAVDEKVWSEISHAIFTENSELNTLQDQLKGLKKTLKVFRHASDISADTLANVHEIESLVTRKVNGIAALQHQAPTTKVIGIPEMESWLRQSQALKLSVKELQQKLQVLKGNFQQQAMAMQKANILKSFVESTTVEVNEKLLLHALGDFFGKGTKLEGTTEKEVLDHRYWILESKINSLKAYAKDACQTFDFICDWLKIDAGSPLHAELTHDIRAASTLKSQILTALSILNTMHPSVEEVDPTAKLAEKLNESLSPLKEGESLFFPGGWTDHAMYYEFTRQANGMFKLRVYNTGAGLAYHPKTTIELKEKYATYIEKIDIPLENIIQRPLLKALIELQNHPVDKANAWGADDVYLSILDAIGGKLNPQAYSEENLHSAQRSGTCAMMSLVTLLGTQIEDPSARAKAHFEMQLKTLIEYKHYKGTLHTDVISLNLLEKSLEEISRVTKARYDAGDINSFEFAYASEKISQVHEFWQNEKQTYLEEITKNSPELKFYSENSVSEFTSDFSSVKASLVSDKKADDSERPVTPYLPLEVQSWIPNFNTFGADLKHYLGNLATPQKSYDQMGAVRNYEILIQKIPRTWLSDEFAEWKVLPDEQKLEIIHSLNTFTQIAYDSLIRNSRLHPARTDVVEPQLNLAMLKVATLAHKILYTCKLDPMPDIKLFAPGYDERSPLTHDLGYFNPYIPEWDDEIKSMKAYWNEDKYYSSGTPISTLFPPGKIQDKGRDSYSHDTSNLQDWMQRPWVEWTLKVIQTPAVNQKLKERYPDFNSYSLPTQCFIALSHTTHTGRRFEHKPDIMPGYYYDMVTILLTLTSLDRVPQESVSLDQLSHVSLYAEQTEKDKWVTNSVVPPGKDIQIIRSNDKNAHRLIVHPILSKIYRTDFQSALIREKQNQLFSSTFLEGIKDSSNRVSLSIQAKRALAVLLSDSKIQVKETLAYFIANPSLLADPDYQTLFQLLMFEPTLLLDELRTVRPDAEKMTTQLATFSSIQYRRSLNLGQLETAIFFLHVNELFKRYSDYAQVTPADPSAQGFMDTRIELRTLLKREDLPLHVRSMANQELALCYDSREHLSPHEIAEVFKAVFYATSHPLKLPYAERQKELAIERTFRTLAEVMKIALEGHEKDTILDRIVLDVFGDTILQQWEESPNFPIFISKDGTYRIDIINALAEKNGSFIVPLPKDIAGSSLMKSMFGSRMPDEVLQLRPGAYSFRFKEVDYRVKEIDKWWGKEITLDRNFAKDGSPEWYRLWDYDNIWANNKPGNLVLGLLKGYNHWLSSEDPQKLLITDVQTHSVRFRGRTGRNYENYEDLLTDISPVDNLGKAIDLTLADVSQMSAPWNFLTNFEDLNFILTWQDPQTKRLKRIDFPRFGSSGLTFEIKQAKNGDLVAESPDYVGYHLANKQDIPALKGHPNFLLLEGPGGKQKVLLPRQSLEKEKDRSSLNLSQISPKRDVQTSDVTRQRVLEYDVDAESGELRATTDEGRIYLAMVFLWRMDYAQANKLLRGFESYLRPYNQEEMEVLLWIIKSLSDSRDHDPRSLTLSLYAAYLLRKNSNDYQMRSADTWQRLDEDRTLNELYGKYVNQLNNIHAIRLKEHEELIILDALDGEFIEAFGSKSSELNEAMVNRLLQLDPAKGRLAQAKIASQEKATTKKFSAAPLVQKLDKSLSSPQDFLNSCSRSEYNERQGTLSAPGHILKADVRSRFRHIYKIFTEQESDKEKLEKLYKDLTGLPFSSKEGENWKRELSSAFGLMSVTNNRENYTALRVLNAVLHYPDEFPSADTVMLAFSPEEFHINAKYNPLVQEIFNKVKALESKHPELGTFFKDNPEATSEQPKDSVLLPAPKRAEETSAQALSTAYAISLNTKVPLLLPYPQAQLLQHGIRQSFVSPTPPVGLSALPAENLREIFSIQSNDKVVDKELARTSSSVLNYQASLKAGVPSYEIADEQQFKLFTQNLRQQVTAADGKLQHMEGDLLKVANYISTQPVERLKEKITQIGENQPLLTVPDLIQLFWRRDVLAYNKLNANLTPDDIADLQEATIDYLLQANHRQYLNRMLTKIEEINAAKNENAPKAEIDELLKQLMGLSNAKYTYDVKVHPEYLVLEHLMDIRMRQEQTDNLDLLNVKNGKIGNPEKLGVVLEMIMGSGKSAVILPLLALLNADGDNLSMMVVPEALLPSMSQMLAQLQGMGFKQSIQVMEFDRNTVLNQDSLQWTLDRLNHIRREKQALMMTSSSLQSLYLKYIEHQYRYAHALGDDKILESELKQFKEIFRILKEKGVLTLDEADLILYVRREHHFTLGSAQPLNSDLVAMVSTLYTLLETDQDLRNIMTFDFSVGAKGKAQPFTSERYEKEVVPMLVEKILKKNLGSTNKALAAFLTAQSEQERSHLKAFLANSKDKASYDYVAAIKDPLVKDLLALAREEIHTLMKLTCGKFADMHFGTHPGKVSGAAIPYHGSNNPAIKAQFGNAFETLNYTIQLYLKKGIDLATLKPKIDALKAEALLELKKNDKITLKDTNANKEFVKLCGSDRYNLFGPDNQFEEILKKINTDPALIIHFVREYIASNIATYPYTISSTPQLFNFLFRVVNGFTGTQWNAETFPTGLQAIPDTMITGKTLDILWRNSQDKIHSISKIEPQHFAKELFSNNPQLQHAQAIIDTAGLARGIDNFKIAKDLLALPCFEDRSPPVKGVVFYDSNDNLMILERGKDRGKDRLIPLSQSTIPKEHRITFYDQKHTTGSDIKQSAAAVGLMTIGQHIILRDLLQSVWRLRGLDKSQKVEFIVDGEVKSLIITTIEKLTGKTIDGEPTLEHIILFATYNQAMLQGDNNYRALKQKMTAVLQAEFMGAVLSGRVEGTALKDIFKSVEGLFITENVSSPWQLFGQIKTLEDSESVVEKAYNRTVEGNTFQTINGLHSLAPKTTESSLSTNLKVLATEALSTLPAKLLTGAEEYGRETELEAEKETEKETEKEKETERETQIQKRDEYMHQAFSAQKLKSSLLDSSFYQWRWLTSFAWFVTFSQTVGNNAKLSPYKNVFDVDLLSTINLQTVNEKNYPYVPFDAYQKPVTDVLVVEDAAGSIKLVMLDQADSIDFRDLLGKDNNEPDFFEKKHGTKLCLYNFELGAYRYGKERLDVDKLEANPQFIKLLVQAKFFNGETHYPEKELVELKKWIAEQGVDKMYNLFKERILAWKADSRAKFPYSTLGKFFQDEGVSVV